MSAFWQVRRAFTWVGVALCQQVCRLQLCALLTRPGRALPCLCAQVVSTFTVNEQSHYQFSPRDVTAWVHGLKRCVGERRGRPTRWQLCTRAHAYFAAFRP